MNIRACPKLVVYEEIPTKSELRVSTLTPGQPEPGLRTILNGLSILVETPRPHDVMPVTRAEGIYIVCVTWIGLQGKLPDLRLMTLRLLHARQMSVVLTLSTMNSSIKSGEIKMK